MSHHQAINRSINSSINQSINQSVRTDLYYTIRCEQANLRHFTRDY